MWITCQWLKPVVQLIYWVYVADWVTYSLGGPSANSPLRGHDLSSFIGVEIGPEACEIVGQVLRLLLKESQLWLYFECSCGGSLLNVKNAGWGLMVTSVLDAVCV